MAMWPLAKILQYVLILIWITDSNVLNALSLAMCVSVCMRAATRWL